MLTEEERDRIEELKKSLYSKTNPPSAIVKRRRMHESPHTVPENWVQNEDSREEVFDKKQYSSLFKWLLVFAVFFFLASAGVAAYVYYHGSNLVSANNISISVIGPVSIAAGAPLTLDVDVTNKNNTKLLLADLTLDYPDGTKSPVDFDAPLKSDQMAIDSLAPGETVRKTYKSVLYGEENTKENVKVTLTYRIPASNAVFTKDADYSVLIASAPVTLTVDSLKEINSGQDLTLETKIVSNVSTDIKNLLLKVDYPFGFTFKNATPTPSFQNNTWSLGDLSLGDSRNITITGKVTGQDLEQRIFHFNTGTASSSNVSNISTSFINTSKTVAIKKPFLASQVTLDGDTSLTHVVKSGAIIQGGINWQNNLTTPINNAAITLSLDGAMIDKNSVEVDEGFYSSVDNTITWDKNGVSNLEVIAPGSTGSVHFSFNTLLPSFDTEKTFRNPVITLDESVEGKRFSDTNAPESISSSQKRSIQVASNILPSASLVYSSGPFTNVGPLPPKAEKATTYTINWAITNSYNRVDNVIMTANIPSYVKWLGNFSPNTEQVSFNPKTNQIEWRVGQIAAGTGFVNSPKTLSFQVSLTPSVSQIGISPNVLSGITLKGVDNFTRTNLVNTSRDLTSNLSSDPNYHYGTDVVVP